MKLLVMLMLALLTLSLNTSMKFTKLVRPLNPSLGNKIPQIRSNRPGIRGGQSEPGPQGTAGPEGTADPEGTAGPEGTADPEGTAGPEGTADPEGTAGPEGVDHRFAIFGPQGVHHRSAILGPQGVDHRLVRLGPQGVHHRSAILGPQGVDHRLVRLGPQGVHHRSAILGPQGPNGQWIKFRRQFASGLGRRMRGNLNKQNLSHFVNIDQTNLKWQTWNGSLPNGAVSIYNKYVKRTDYICKHDCDAGFYRSDEGPFCHYSDKEVGHQTSQFEILVNVENIEILEWKEASRGSVPQHSVLTCPDKKNVYVGMNKYGLGKVVPQKKAFFLPWHNTEYWYHDYQVLTFSKDVVSEHIYDVTYKMDEAKITESPPKTIDKSSISNNLCQSISETMTLTKTTQESQKWDHSFSVQVGAKISITAQIPMLASEGIELSMQVSYQFTKETTHTESNTHTVSITYNVPPNQFCTVRMVGKESEVTVPYMARFIRTFRDGETREASMSGTYKGVQVGEVQTIVDRCEPKAHNEPCPEKQISCQ